MGGTVSDYRSKNVFVRGARAGKNVARSLRKRDARSNRRPHGRRSADYRTSRHRDVNIETSRRALFAVLFGDSDSTGAASERPSAAGRSSGIQRREPGATGKANGDKPGLGRL